MLHRLLLSVLLLFSLAGAALPADKKTLVSDDQIYDEVRRKLASDPLVKGGGFTVDVKNGVVTIKGTVETEKQKQKANKLARKIKGVRSVDNELMVKGK